MVSDSSSIIAGNTRVNDIGLSMLQSKMCIRDRVGLCCGAGLRLAVYLRGKNAKKYRHGVEYGSARWGTQKDIEPFEDPVFANNVILTRTERLMMSNRPPDPKNARNKNVLVVGGSGSGKTRFWLKPNLLQCHSSYVVTDPKGYNYQG